jgi:hypothetical protein
MEKRWYILVCFSTVLSHIEFLGAGVNHPKWEERLYSALKLWESGLVASSGLQSSITFLVHHGHFESIKLLIGRSRVWPHGLSSIGLAPYWVVIQLDWLQWLKPLYIVSHRMQLKNTVKLGSNFTLEAKNVFHFGKARKNNLSKNCRMMRSSSRWELVVWNCDCSLWGTFKLINYPLMKNQGHLHILQVLKNVQMPVQS